MLNEVRKYLQKPYPQRLIDEGDFESLYKNAKEFLSLNALMIDLIHSLQDADIPIRLENTLPGLTDYIHHKAQNIQPPLSKINGLLRRNVLSNHNLNYQDLFKIFNLQTNSGFNPSIIKGDIRIELVYSLNNGKIYMGPKYTKAGGGTSIVRAYELLDIELNIAYGLGIGYELAMLQYHVDVMMQKMKIYMEDKN